MQKRNTALLCAIALIMAALSAGVAAKCAEPERMEAPARNNATQAVRACENDTQAEPSDPIPCREDVSVLFYAEEIESEWAELHPAETDSPEKITTYWEEIPLSADVQAYIFAECEKRDIAQELVFAVIWQESSYRENAIGGGGKAFGLMQIWKTAHEKRMEKLGVTDLLDPIQNVSVGIDYLDELIDKYNGDVSTALVAYNCGPTGAYRNYFSNGVFESSYSRAVLDKCEKLKT